jgi:hypothetical protein
VLVVAAQPAAADDKKLWAGGELAIMPLGWADSGGSNGARAEPVVFALGGAARYGISPLLSVGAGMRLSFGVLGIEQEATGRQLDLRVRVAVGKAVAPTVKVFGFVAPGYAWLSDEMTSPSGPLLGFGAGASYALGPGIALTGELAFQRAKMVEPSSTGLLDDYRLDQSFIQISGGFVVPLR